MADTLLDAGWDGEQSSSERRVWRHHTHRPDDSQYRGRQRGHQCYPDTRPECTQLRLGTKEQHRDLLAAGIRKQTRVSLSFLAHPFPLCELQPSLLSPPVLAQSGGISGSSVIQKAGDERSRPRPLPGCHKPPGLPRARLEVSSGAAPSHRVSLCCTGGLLQSCLLSAC